MTEEEKKAIENFDKRLTIEKYTNNIGTPVYIEDIATILNLIQKQQAEIERLNNLNNHQSKDNKKAVDYTFELNAELEKKDKIIDEMAEVICRLDTMNNYDTWENNIENVKQYFEKKVGEK